MNSLNRAAGAIGLVGLTVAAFAQDGNGFRSLSSDTTWSSKYIWRGLVVDNQPAFQSSSSFGFAGWSLNLWSSKRASRAFDPGSGSEWDVTLSRELQWGGVTLTPGFTYYTYPGLSAPATGEGFVGLETEVQGLTFFTNHYLDMMQFSGAYYGEAGLGVEHEFTNSLSLGGQALVGWGNRKFHHSNFGSGGNCATVFSAGLYLNVHITGALSLQPSVTYSHLLDRAVRSTATKPDNWIWGLTIGISH
ncbi:MAG: hypothetical protein HZC36_01690 [Armatimonadetes bacterium]|nr:hypothetical protein [Armatimonadota bacterium]